MPKISFIIPVYGVEKYIHKCLDSVINQTFKDIEIIIVDDGSPDKCPQICDEYAKKDARIKVIHKKNGGVSAARNTGIDAASGEWAYFVDSDDWIELDAAEKLYNEAIDKNVDCVFSDPIVRYTNRDVRGNMFSHPFVTDDRNIIQGIQKFMLCQKYNPYYTPKTSVGVAAPWAKFVRMEVLKNNNVYFDPYALGRFDDGIWTLYMLEYVKNVSYIQTYTYNYRITGTSICYAFKKNALEIIGRGFELTEKFIAETHKDYSFTEAHYGRVCRYLSLYLSQYFFSNQNPKKYSDKAKELRMTLKTEPYKTAIRKVDLSKLEFKHRCVVIMARLGFVPGMRFYACLKTKKKQ